MIPPLFLNSFLTILSGITYGIIMYSGKIYLLKQNNPMRDFLFTALRFSLIFLFFYVIFKFVASNSILLSILFVSSYLSTIGIIAYNM